MNLRQAMSAVHQERIKRVIHRVLTWCGKAPPAVSRLVHQVGRPVPKAEFRQSSLGDSQVAAISDGQDLSCEETGQVEKTCHICTVFVPIG